MKISLPRIKRRSGHNQKRLPALQAASHHRSSVGIRVSRFKRKAVRVCQLALILLTVCLFSYLCFAVYHFYINSARPLFLSPLAPGGGSGTDQIDISEKVNSIEEYLVKNNISYKKIYLGSQNDAVVRLQDNGEVLLSLNRDIQIQLTSLQYILIHFTMEGRKFVRLDLRYDKPAIRLN